MRYGQMYLKPPHVQNLSPTLNALNKVAGEMSESFSMTEIRARLISAEYLIKKLREEVGPD